MLTEEIIQKVICSTLHIVMIEPETKLPVGIGSGCVINYNGRSILLTAAHVTNITAATCIDLGKPVINKQNELYSVGAMNYLQKYDVDKYRVQMIKYFDKDINKEDKDYGLIDFSFAQIKDEIEIFQKEIQFPTVTIKPQRKIIIDSNIDTKPSQEKEHYFFGRINPTLEKHPFINIFETQEIFHSGLKYIETIGFYYKFQLTKEINNNMDYKGTSGAPIFDADGNLISLVTHGYEKEKYIYGIALSIIKKYFDSYIDGAVYRISSQW